MPRKMRYKIGPVQSVVISYVLLFLSLAGAVEAQSFQLSKQIVFEEMGRMNTRTFLEDSYGFIWIGARGLYKYDGSAIRKQNFLLEDSTKFNPGLINALLEDSNGKIWIGADNGLFCYDRFSNTISRFLKDSPNYQTANGRILSLCEDEQQRLWVGDAQNLYVLSDLEIDDIRVFDQLDLGERRQGALGVTAIQGTSGDSIFAASNKGIWMVEKDSSLKQFLPEQWQDSHQEFQVLDAAMDHGDSMWLATNDGAWLFDFKNKSFSKLDIPKLTSPVLLDVLVSTAGDVWFGTQKDGLFRLKKDGGIEGYEHDPDNPYTPIDSRILALLYDRFDNLWVGTLFGVSRVNLDQQRFPFYQIDPGPHKYDNYVFRVMEDSLGGLWFRLLRLGLGYSPGPGRDLDVLLRPEPSSIGEEIKDFCVDPDGDVWVITLTNGLFRFRKGTRRFESIDLGDSLKQAYTHTILSDQKNGQYLWFTSKFGLCRVDRFTFKRKWFRLQDDLPEFEDSGMGSLEQSEDYNFWFTRMKGGKRQILCFDYDSERFSNISELPINPSIPHFRTGQVKALSGNRIWIGTTIGLIQVDASTKTFQLITEKEGLPVPSVRSITPDLQGNIWFTGPTKICKFDGQQYACFDGQHDIDLFNSTSVSLGASGRVSFGGRNGLYSFYPEDIEFKRDTFPLPVHLTNFKVFNKPRRLDKAYELIEQIELPYNENAFSLEFSALYFLQPDQIRYKYRLRPFEDEWREADFQTREIPYPKLSPGTYTFQVKASLDGERWSADTEDLKITLRILPPWYLTWWAYCLYGLFSIALLMAVWGFQLRKQLAKAETLRLKGLDKVKTRLYTNITHEFRTPLTIINGTTTQLKQKVNYDNRLELDRIHRNGEQLLDLVNQMLDLTKLEDGKLGLYMVHGDVVQFLNYLYASFRSLATSKGISWEFQADTADILMDFDSEKLRQIVSNLLSNALKFTAPGGSVLLSVDVEHERNQGGDNRLLSKNKHATSYLRIKVTDTGIGIAPDQLDKVFSRFYQVDNSSTKAGEGSGIGLTLSKELVNLLGGQIGVKSQVEKGSEFFVVLPIKRESTIPFEWKEKDQKLSDNLISNVLESKKETSLSQQEQELNRPQLLLIDDNKDVLAYFQLLLQDHYALTTAKHGKEGLDFVHKEMPDLIICDVMMPEMDGFQFCRTLKEDVSTCHIPIILLTAKADMDSRLEGIEYGADIYLSKPVVEKELKIWIRKLLQNRERLKQFYTSGPFFKHTKDVPTVDPPHSTVDHGFFSSLVQQVEASLSDPPFTAEKLSEQLFMSYPTCLRKVKGVTGMTIKEYIRHIRIHRASYLLLEQPNRKITSIALEVGFASNAHFSREFRKAMGLSPTAYRKENLA